MCENNKGNRGTSQLFKMAAPGNLKLKISDTKVHFFHFWRKLTRKFDCKRRLPLSCRLAEPNFLNGSLFVVS